MSIQSEIDRISGNVQDTISTIRQTGVTIPSGANSDNLPSLAAALANEKQDKLTGTEGQIVGFDSSGNAVAQDAPSGGITQEQADARYVPLTQKGAVGGVASLDSSGKVPSSQLPAMDYIPTSQKGAAGGVATLGNDGKIPEGQLPEMDFIPVINGGITGNFAALKSDGTLQDSGKKPADFATADHKHSADDITSGTLPVSRGGTGATTFTSGYALIGNGTSAVTGRAITNLTSTGAALTANTNLITANTLHYMMNRTGSVAAANTSYTTLMARGSSLHSAQTSPTINGAIAWQYE